MRVLLLRAALMRVQESYHQGGFRAGEMGTNQGERVGEEGDNNFSEFAAISHSYIFNEALNAFK